jgi:hypothetical protein
MKICVNKNKKKNEKRAKSSGVWEKRKEKLRADGDANSTKHLIVRWNEFLMNIFIMNELFDIPVMYPKKKRHGFW